LGLSKVALFCYVGNERWMNEMPNRLTHRDASRGLWLVRLRAGALALLFAALTLLPWLHIITADGHPGHTCCGVVCCSPAGSAPVVTSAGLGSENSCWICQNLCVLLQHTVASGGMPELHVTEKTVFVAHAPQAPVIRFVDPATRSQAPPAHV